jgi:peptidoglycan/LPS O-acetylase OafA/YrhL
MQTHHRVGEYCIGIIAGYLMHKFDAPEYFPAAKARKQISFCWILSLTFITVHVFLDPKSQLSQTNQNFYDAVSKELWAISICWIIFACHHLKSGGLIRSFLSHHSWQPLSKMCLSIYLIHFLYITMTIANQKVWQKPETWWQIHIHTGDVFISIILAAGFWVSVEAPTANVIAVMWKLGKSSSSVDDVSVKIESSGIEMRYNKLS